jgi:GTPase KRas
MTSCFRNGNITEAAEDNDTNDLQHEIHLTRRAMMRYSLLGQNLEEDASQPGYHVDLGNSKVYRRTEQYESDVTFTSSAIRTHAWSIFSDMSLSEVSLISAIALPLHLDEISNQEWYTLGEPDNINSDVSSQATGQLFKSSAVANVVPKTVFSTARNWRRLASRSEYEGYRQSAMEQRARLFRNRDRAANNGNTPSKGIGSPILRDPDATVERPVNSTTDISHQSPSKPEGIQMPLYKLVLLGDNDVGKTALSIQVDTLSNSLAGLLIYFQLCLQHFVETYDPSIEDSYRKQVVIDGQACLLEVLDTAGQEEYTALRDQWIRDGEGFVLVYCIASRCSFNRIRRYHNQVLRVKESTAISPSYPGSPISGPSPQDYPLMLIGNNSHLVTEREVSTQEGHALARELGCGFVEASAKNCINVEKPFYDIIRQLRRQRLHARAAERRRQAYENQKGTPA